MVNNSNIMLLTDDDLIETDIYIYELLDEYMESNAILFSKPHFEETMIETVTDVLYEEWFILDLIKEDNYGDLYELVESICDLYFDTFNVPNRSQLSTFSLQNKTKEEIYMINEKIDTIKNIYQPKQRTNEWHKFRHDLFTASSIWKIFGTESQYNSIIYEKCKPFEENSHNKLNFCNPMSWGNKYEPVSIQLYEKIYNTKVEDFGCIKHPNYDFEIGRAHV